MERTDQEPEMDPWHLLLAVGWGFLTALAFIGDVYRYSDNGRPVHPNDEEFVATIRPPEGSARTLHEDKSASSTNGPGDSEASHADLERAKRREELTNESTLAYDNGSWEPSFVGFLSILPCGLFFGASCVLTFCGPKGRVAGAALGLSVLWIWAFQHSTFWHPRWM
jgi:hypothetical protein